MDAMQCCSAAEAEEAGVAERGDMEVLEEFFGLGFGGHSIDMDSKDALIGSESLLMPLGPPPPLRRRK